MFEFSLISIFAITFSIWTILSGKFYRNPSLIAILGLVLALYGAWLSYTLNQMSSQETMSEIFPWLALSSSLISYTIAATGGSLIASGVILKIQFLHEKEKSRAMGQLNITLRELEIAREMDKNLKITAPLLSNEEFKNQHSQIQERKTRAIIELIEIRNEYRHLIPKDC
jgi:hypothetical protein